MMSFFHHLLVSILASVMAVPLFSSCKSEQGMMDASLLLPSSFTYNRQWQQARIVIGKDTDSVWVKGRGHSTFMQPKHPLELKWNTKKDFRGIKPHKHWVMLANFFDHSLMRNALAMEVARQTSLKSVTPKGLFVSLNVNGEGQGIYWMTERVKDKAKATDSLLKLDVYHWHNQRERGLSLDTFPSTLPLDTLSLVDWWLIHELCMNAEPNGPRSCYLRVTTDGRIAFGPVWDFDMAFNELGVDNGGDLRPKKFKTMKTLPPFLQGKEIRWLSVDSFYCDQSVFMRSLFHDKRFRQLSLQRWLQLRPRFVSLTQRIDQWTDLLRSKAPADQRKWNSLEPARFDSSSTWEEAVQRLKATYLKRIEAMDHLLSNLP